MGEGRLVVGAALGDCVHTAGVLNFLAAARRAGFRTEFLGPAVPVGRLAEAAAARRPELLAVSYRLTPAAAERLFAQLRAALAAAGLTGQRLVFGGTPVVAEVAARSGLFEAVFGASGGPSAEEYLAGGTAGTAPRDWAQTLVERCRQAAPRPVIRHHFGLPDLDDTVAGIERIAAAGVVDVVSLGPDQNFQEHFFHPERMDPAQDGAGGVPVRSADDLRRLYAATRQGNYPLMRCYSGTNDQVALAEVLHDTIRNAWCAVPVFWYSELDGRSTRSLEQAIAEHAALVAWYAAHGEPVERNDQNQWGLRQASDTVQVAAAALAAGLSAAAGVKTVCAADDAEQPLGHLPGHGCGQDGGHGVPGVARRRRGRHRAAGGARRAVLHAARPGPGAGPTGVGHPHRHAAAPQPPARGGPHRGPPCHRSRRPDCLLQSGAPGDRRRPAGPARSAGRPEGGREAGPSDRRGRATCIEAIEQRFPGALAGDPAALAGAVRGGYLDAPYLAGIPAARGAAITVVDGGCDAVDPAGGRVLSERERLAALE